MVAKNKMAYLALIHERIQDDNLCMCQQFGVDGKLYVEVMRTQFFMAKDWNWPHHHAHQV